MRPELPRYVYGTLWADSEGRRWRVVKHPDLKVKMLQLDGQEPELYHHAEHIEAEFGTLKQITEIKK